VLRSRRFLCSTCPATKQRPKLNGFARFQILDRAALRLPTLESRPDERNCEAKALPAALAAHIWIAALEPRDLAWASPHGVLVGVGLADARLGMSFHAVGRDEQEFLFCDNGSEFWPSQRSWHVTVRDPSFEAVQGEPTSRGLRSEMPPNSRLQRTGFARR